MNPPFGNNNNNNGSGNGSSISRGNAASGASRLQTPSFLNSVTSSFNNAMETFQSLPATANQMIDEQMKPPTPSATSSSWALPSFSASSASSSSGGPSATEFLTSNTLVAKMMFVLVVAIGFMAAAWIGFFLIQFFSDSSRNPYLVYGRLNGDAKLVISQNPKDPYGHTVTRSVNQRSGLEMTWSLWIMNLQTQNDTTSSLSAIFRKGSVNSSLTAGQETKLVNGPGLYLDNKSKLVVLVDELNTGDASKTESVKIETYSPIPVNKWVHVVIRVRNTVCDIYVNGSIAKRQELAHAPYQNYEDVLVGQNFNGEISNLAYYPYALSALQINSITMGGPNLTTANTSASQVQNSGVYSFLSSGWYISNYFAPAAPATTTATTTTTTSS